MLKVTYFVNFSKFSKEERLCDFLDKIKDGTFEQKVSQVREFFAAGKVEEAQRLKKSLSAVTVSALYEGGRKEAFMRLYQALVMLDYDGVTHEVLMDLVKNVNSDPHTLASFISPSGNGLKVFVRTKPQEGELPQAPAQVKAYHKLAYNQVVEYYSQLTGVQVDVSGKDPTRLCFASFDPNLFANFDSTPIVIMPEVKKEKVPETAQERTFRLAYRNISQTMTYQGGQRNNFVYYLANLLNRKGMAKEITTDFFIHKFIDLDLKEITSAIDSAYKHVEDHGVMLSQTKADVVEEMEKYLRNHYELRFNLVTDRVEMRDKGADVPYQRMEDREENTIWRQLHMNGISAKVNDLRLLMNSDFSPKYDPFLDYFDNLPKWDGKDHLTQFAATITVDSDPDYWVFCLRKWMTAMVASLLQKDVVNHTVLVFIGEQGVGKSKWCERIFPPELSEYYTLADLDENPKDLLTKFSHFAGINLDELGMLTSHDLLRLNKLVSQGVINQRKVYAHNEARYERRASLMASTNIEQVLIDPTGTRRFPTFKVTSIDYMHTTNYNQLYAQIKHLLDTGYQFWYDKEEIRELNIHNERFLFLTPEEEFLLTYFTKEKIHDQPEYLTVSEILKRISHRTGLQLNNINVSNFGKCASHVAPSFKLSGFSIFKRSSHWYIFL